MVGRGGVAKYPPNRYSPVTPTNVGISPEIFLTFRFNSFKPLVQNLKSITSASPKSWNLNQDHPSNDWFFWLISYRIEAMITSLIEMLELPNFGHMRKSTI